MSYYTFFYLKPDSKFKDTTLDEVKTHCKSRDSSNVFFTDNEKIEAIANIVNAYYIDNIHQKTYMISLAVRGYILRDYYNYEYKYLKELLEDDDHALVRNHCPDEYELSERISNFNDLLQSTVQRIVVLATVKFKPDDRYSDTPKTESSYLRTEFIDEVEEELGFLVDMVDEYYFAKFVTEECISESEDQKYNREHNSTEDNNDNDN